MTLSQLKALNEQNGGLFFSRHNMRVAGDTMKNFGIRKLETKDRVLVYRKRATKFPINEWIFDTTTGRVVHYENRSN
jgi:hypothetical protein